MKQKAVKDKKELEAEWAGKWNEAGLKLANLVMDETDSPNEALFLLDIAKSMIENAVKAVEIEAHKGKWVTKRISKNATVTFWNSNVKEVGGVEFHTRKKPEKGR